MIFDVLTLFPMMVGSILNESIIGRAREAGLIELRTHDIRDFSNDKNATRRQWQTSKAKRFAQ